MTTAPTPLHDPIAAAMEPPSPLILVAEDDVEMRELLRQALERAGYRVALCPHGLDLLLHLTDPDAMPPLEEISLGVRQDLCIHHNRSLAIK